MSVLKADRCFRSLSNVSDDEVSVLLFACILEEVRPDHTDHHCHLNSHLSLSCSLRQHHLPERQRSRQNLKARPHQHTFFVLSCVYTKWDLSTR